jgi:hypothetical protein
MVVSVTWSTSAGGAALAEPLDHGVIGNGSVSSVSDLYISHDGTNDITSCGFYIRAYSGGSYDGDFTANDDYTELVSWGDAWVSAGDGGLELNQNPAVASWSIHKTGQGVSGNAIELATTAGVAGAGIMTSAEEAHVQIRTGVPVAESVGGYRMFDYVFSFVYTS